MTKVHILQVNDRQAPGATRSNIQELDDAIAAGHTGPEGWQMPKRAAPGDLVVWYAAGTLGKHFMAKGRVEGHPARVNQGYGPYRGQVAGIKRIPPVDRRQVLQGSGVDGGLQGPQTVPDEKAEAFLKSLRLLD
jgi:hypothetical protein